MKKSFFYRTLQVALAIAAYSSLYIWAATTHTEPLYSILTDLDSLLISLAIAVALPILCFKVLRKLYTPPKSLQVQDLPNTNATGLEDGEEENIEVMQYRGMRYKPEDVTIGSEARQQAIEATERKTVIKYRGVSIEDQPQSSSSLTNFAPTEQESQDQPSSKPKLQRIKYRGAYLD